MQLPSFAFEPGIRYGGANTTSAGVILASWVRTSDQPLLVVTSSLSESEHLFDAAELWLGDGVTLFPDLPLTPYDLTDLPVTIQASWVDAWNRIHSGRAKCGIMTPSIAAYPPLYPGCMELQTETVTNRDEVIQFLSSGGYRRVDLCETWGDMTIRGGLMDVFSPGSLFPVRIEFDGNRIQSIRSFSVEDQRTRDRLDRVLLLTFDLLPESSIADLAVTLRERITGLGGDRMVDNLLTTRSLGPLSLYYPVNEKRTLGNVRVVHYNGEAVSASMESLLDHYKKEHGQSRDSGFLDVGAEEILRHYDLMSYPDAILEPFRSVERARTISNEGVVTVRGTPSAISSDIQNLLHRGFHVHIAAQNEGNRTIIQRFLDERELTGISWLRGRLHESWVTPDHNLALIPDTYILGPTSVPRQKRGAQHAYRLLLDQLKPGDPIVHVEHGVGRFQGLHLIDGSDFVTVDYSDGQLFVPTDSMDMLTSYVGAEGERAPLHSLGGKVWQGQKRKAQKVAEHIVQELAELYAERQAATGIAFPEDDDFQRSFEFSFPFEETQDQVRAIQEVKEDMQVQKPMDRLLCGDVGFGKTEVALRAAFKAIAAGYQVAILAPTTVLAYQHFRTFTERFQNFPVKVEWLSRFISSTRQKEIIESVARGEVDIVIGTHRLLSRDIHFSSLGLLVIDEEQRFGVKQKEQIRQMRKNVDVLALSATPIPRTLYMSLMDIRDLSIINTAPRGRRAIETTVATFNPTLIRDAILHETSRDGQVFFIHNRVQEIPRILHFLDELIPEVTKVVTHGQMDEASLERNLLTFVRGEAHLLLTTTIIENGIDIPRANTMIVNNAHFFGLSQLYQLRGRVGRSVHQAYCYLLVPSLHTLGEQARDRLVALEEFSQLGSGFKIAARDLDIRGAGNLLGVEQHGHVEAVGYELFCRMVEKAARVLRGEEVEELPPVQISLGIPMAIPASYISDEMERMAIYRKLLKGDISAVREECEDRFGPPPPEVTLLYKVFALRKRCEDLRITALQLTQEGVSIQFHSSTRVNIRKLLDYAQKIQGARLSPRGEFLLPVRDTGERLIPALSRLLASLNPGELL
ncbi:MAG TPA: transcription-repair coupling factor [Thermoanaerobaculia bacterium]|nr:transcription-repair coupling factor [Thermoanaerobaculia bacterium]HUM28526.1 transcription-repair coupling factor [Thermoanaerobaculia bacterium]HXK66866.1 transcription-repair coupling factor [Thermoanaerobaculia bacterium]